MRVAAAQRIAALPVEPTVHTVKRVAPPASHPPKLIGSDPINFGPPPFIAPFVAWQLTLTGVGAVDAVIDVLVKLVLSPVLLVIGVADLFGAGWFDAIHNRIAIRVMTGREREDALRQIRATRPKEVTETIARLARRDDLGPLMQQLNEDGQRRLWAVIFSKLDGPEASAVILDWMIRASAPDHLRERAVQRLHALGQLDATLRVLRALRPDDVRVDSLALASERLPRPLIIGHRGLPGSVVENTIPSLQAAIDAGADGVEIDLCVTKDGEVVLWHDDDPDSMIGLMRQGGLEPGQAYHPVVPLPGSELRRSVHTLTLAELRASHGYAKGSVLKHEREIVGMPVIAEVSAWAERTAKCKRIVLDTKLPPDASPKLIRAYAEKVKAAFAVKGMAERCVVMSPHRRIVDALKPLLGERFHYTYDTEIVSAAPDPRDVTGLEDGRAAGNDTVSVGRPRVGVDGYESYLHLLYATRAKWSGERPRVVAWTLNEERELREVIGSGIVDEILTDEPAKLAKLRAELFGEERAAPVRNPFAGTFLRVENVTERRGCRKATDTGVNN